jgi:hypothetical protein
MASSNPQESLFRATSGQSQTNYATIIRGFMAKGIAESEIQPRVNVFTYNAWQAKGRIVKRGEHGVKCLTFVEMKDRTTGQSKRRPTTTTVFHISQTEPVEVANANRALYKPVQTQWGTVTPKPRRAENTYETMSDEALAALAAPGKGKALVELTESECMAMMEQMRRAALNPTLDKISQQIADESKTIDVTPLASPETEYNPQLAAERVAERRETRRAEQLRETAQWFTMLPASEIEPIIGHMPGTKEYGQFKSWNRLTQEAQDALHYARTVNPQTPRERVLAGQPVSILDLMPDKIDKRPGQPQPLKPTIKRRDFKF